MVKLLSKIALSFQNLSDFDQEMNGNLIYVVAHDVTERIEYENKLLEASNKDSLTNVYNRRYIYKRGEEIIEEYKRTGQSFLIIERILDIVRNKTFIFDGIEIKFTFSAGILNSEELAKDLNTIDNMVNIADKRMYHAKNTGRNKIIYNMKTMQL